MTDFELLDISTAFLTFTMYTDESDVLVQYMLPQIFARFGSGRLTVTDIGGGSGIVAGPLILALKKQFEVTYHFVEPAARLIEHFKENYDTNGIVFTSVRLKVEQNHLVAWLRRNDSGGVWLQGA